MLRDCTATGSRFNTLLEWLRVGTSDEPLNNFIKLQDYLSYDEMIPASLLDVSSPTFFINDGNRFNSGQPGLPGTFQPRGVIVGLVGARFERKDRMDSGKCAVCFVTNWHIQR